MKKKKQEKFRHSPFLNWKETIEGVHGIKP